MSNLTYTDGLPNPPNFPSQDVGSMQVNTNSISQWVQQDHFGFNTAANEGGYHDQVSMQNQAAPGLPAFGTNPIGVLFANNATSPATAPAWPFWQNSLGNFQLSGSASANNPSPTANGYSFLPGGLLIQWGNVVTTGGFGTVTFATANIAFPATCFVVLVTPITNGGSGGTAIQTFGLSNTSFSWTWVNNPAINVSFSWVAIGI